ncbi:MAG: hypothetical protein HRU70_06200 [Phycisphaeraceae bacterium]|nr:MAG: hypothetical protein HRU70_06200 [Phycisphaeraceae bacterium]
MPEVRMHLHPNADPAEVVVVSNERCTAGRKPAGFIRHVVFDVSGTRLEGSFRPGQSFGVIPPGVDARGVPHKVRLYSTSSPTRGEDGQGRHVATTVKRLIDEHVETGRLFLGVASNYLCDLKPGDRVKMTGPSGKRFVLPADPWAHDYVFFATGTGVAPFRGMLMDLFPEGEHPGRGDGGRAVLVMGSPYGTDLLYDGQLRALEARSGGRFRYVTAVSRESGWSGDGRLSGYVHDAFGRIAAVDEVLSGGRALVYVCGVAGMELGVLRGLWRSADGAAFVGVDASAGEPGVWTRRMIHKEVRPSRRVFLEVY